MGVVLGPPDAPPGPRFWATLARAALESAAKGPGGVRGYLAAGSVPPEETALARDAAAGRLAGALLLGAGAGPAEALARVGLASVRLAGDGPGPSVGPAWREAVRETAARMLSRGAWPLAIALPPGPWADDMADGYADALTLRGLAPDPGLVGRADQADGPPGWAWARGLVGRGVRGLLLLGAGPEAALAAVAAARVRVPEDLALVVAAIAGQTPAFSVGLARLELDPMALVQAGLALLADVRRADADGGDRPLPSRRLEPRFIAGATLHMNI
jgi:DNA-binding LacI/PurR family transcriptional regulator